MKLKNETSRTVPIRGASFIVRIMESPNRIPRRSRWVQFFLVLLVIAAGIFLRSGTLTMPRWFANHWGDALWALMVYFGFGFLFPRAPVRRVALLSLVSAWGIEFFQLYQAPWINSIRATVPGRLVLGTTFYWPDLIAYGLGIAMGVGWESRAQRKREPREP